MQRFQIKNRNLEKTVRSLTSRGYKQVPDGNGGDNDFIYVDHERKEWIYCENGFYPFCSICDVKELARALKNPTLEEMYKLRH